MKKYLSRLLKSAGLRAENDLDPQDASLIEAAREAKRFADTYREQSTAAATLPDKAPANALWDYFQNHRSGHGIWKWEHYFEIYRRHFARFVGRSVNVMEIGIYSGGSLEMWRSYFGDQSHIYGVDVEEACQSYANDYTEVFIGDQADRHFWRDIKQRVDRVDILIDDGGHTPEQQRVTLEEMLPHLSPGGIYLCEDVCAEHPNRPNAFAAYAAGLAQELNRMSIIPGPQLQSRVSNFQSAIHSIHFYPYVIVIEKHLTAPEKLAAPKHGTQWQPFLSFHTK